MRRAIQQERRDCVVSFQIPDEGETLSHRFGINCIVSDPVSHTLFTGGRDGTVRRWRTTDGQVGNTSTSTVSLLLSPHSPHSLLRRPESGVLLMLRGACGLGHGLVYRRSRHPLSVVFVSPFPPFPSHPSPGPCTVDPLPLCGHLHRERERERERQA